LGKCAQYQAVETRLSSYYLRYKIFTPINNLHSGQKNSRLPKNLIFALYPVFCPNWIKS